MHQSSKNKINLLQLPKEWRKFYGMRTDSFVFCTHSSGAVALCGPEKRSASKLASTSRKTAALSTFAKKRSAAKSSQI
jgi:hypothetical protein